MPARGRDDVSAITLQIDPWPASELRSTPHLARGRAEVVVMASSAGSGGQGLRQWTVEPDELLERDVTAAPRVDVEHEHAGLSTRPDAYPSRGTGELSFDELRFDRGGVKTPGNGRTLFTWDQGKDWPAPGCVPSCKF
jgi:hypothetical protein